MHEPPFSAFAFAGLVVTILGPVLGPLALLLFAAVMGSMLAMGRVATMTRMEGLKFIAVGVGISLVLSGFAVWLVEKYTAIPGNIALMPVSFAIAVARNSLLGLIDKALDAVATFLNAFANRKGNGS
jgi:hypothetical protein